MHVVIIGAYGSAGVAAADRLADERDVRLTLVDDGDPGGGLCILRGCMPSKELLSAGAHRFQVRDDPRLDGTPTVDVERLAAAKDEHVSNFANHRRAAVDRLADRDDVTLLRDTARFVDDRTVRVGDRELDADYVVVATGSAPNPPDIPGVDDVPYRTSDDLLDATSFGDSAVVLGFGAVGLELVPYLSEVGGADVTVVERDDRPLDAADPEFGDALLNLYREAFDVEVLTNVSGRAVERAGDGVRLTLDGAAGGRTAVEADELYAFTGRRPALDGLDLEQTALDPGEGWVRDTMQAVGDDRTFVVGDVNGREPLLHAAKEQGHLAAENALRHARGEALRGRDAIHHQVVFTGLGVYPFVRVGHTEASADAAGVDAVAVTRTAASDGVFLVKHAPAGCAKLVVDADDGTVLGYQGLHLHADVLAKTLQVVVELGLDVRELPDRAFHPTTPEILDGLIRDAAAAVGD